MPKQSFKIMLNSNYTSNYTGPQFNADYPVIIRDGVRDFNDLDKPYKVYYEMRSVSNATATQFTSGSQFLQTEIYGLCITPNNLAGKTLSNLGILQKNMVSVLSVESDLTTQIIQNNDQPVANIACKRYVRTIPSVSNYFILPTLMNLTSINVAIYNLLTMTVFPGNVATDVRYCVLLTFEEI